MNLPSRITNLPPYIPIEPFEVLSERLGRITSEIIKLDANENPYGMSMRARRALLEMEFPHIYPDPESRLLRSALSEFTGVPAENLLAGAGADELIDLITRILVEPGDTVINCPPTFGMYPFDTELNYGRVVEVPRLTDFSIPLSAIRAAVEEHKPKIIFLASPNNPDGSLISDETIQDLLKLNILVVVDEAYIEFADESHRLGKSLSRITQVMDHENLIVLRTFSKWAGLAGLRIGYGAFPAWIMPALWKSKQPYNVNVAASIAAIASLQDATTLAEVVTRLQEERRRLINGLGRVLYLSPYPTRSNFILCRVTGMDAAELKRELAERYGILIRYFNTLGLNDHIRISVGKTDHTNALLAALHEIQSP